MNALDSPLEALAINYVSFGLFAAVNNLWTWVAVVTAALGFWKIRAGTVSDVKAVSCSSLPDEPSPNTLLREDASSSYGCRSVPEEKPCPSRQTDVISHVTTAASAQHPITTVSPGNVYGMTKGRFTVYYDDNNYQMEEADRAAEMIGAEEVGGCDSSVWWSGWERVLRVRNGDMEWYRYQDLTVLDGSVVRLWDDTRLIR